MLQPRLVGASDLQLPAERWSELEGLITVYTGILPICRDEQGLAVVLAHGHSFFFVEYPTIHWSKRYRNWPRSRPSHRRKAIFTNNKIYPAHGLAIPLWSGLPHWKYASYISPRTSKFPHTRNRRWLFQLFSLSSRVMVPLSADLIGLRLMSRACYDPRAAPEWVILFV